MALIGCVNAYQDADFLAVSLPPLIERCDRVVVVDGCYRDFAQYGCAAASDDGTEQVCAAYGADLLRAVDGLDEIGKRNRYLDVGGIGDWLLVVDADEIVDGEHDRGALRLGLANARQDDYWVRFHEARSGPDEARGRGVFRLHRWRPELRYVGTHHALHCGGRLLLTGTFHDGPTFEPIQLRHVKHMRTVERNERKAHYYQKLGEAERDFRARHKL